MSETPALTFSEVVALAAEAGVTLRPLCKEVNLFNVEGTWCPVYLTKNVLKPGEWRVRRQCRKRWKTVYRGKLPGALKEAATWKKTIP